MMLKAALSRILSHTSLFEARSGVMAVNISRQRPLPALLVQDKTFATKAKSKSNDEEKLDVEDEAIVEEGSATKDKKKGSTAKKVKDATKVGP